MKHAPHSAPCLDTETRHSSSPLSWHCVVTTPSGFPAALEKIYTTAQILLLTPHETLQYLPTHHLFTTYTPKAQAESLDGHLKKKNFAEIQLWTKQGWHTCVFSYPLKRHFKSSFRTCY